MKEREQQVLDSVPKSYRKDLAELIKEYQYIFPEKLPKGVPSEREVQHKIEIDPAVNLPIDHHIDWVLLSRMIWGNRPKLSWLKVSFVHLAVRTGRWFSSYPRKTADGGCVLTIGHSINRPSRTAIHYHG